MKNIKISLGVLLIGILIIGCAVKKPLPSTYFQNAKKVGVVYNIDSIKVYRGSQGVLDAAISSGKKYTEALSIVGKTINPTIEIKNLYQNIFALKSVKLEEIDFKYNINELEKFDKPSGGSKKYHKYDLRNLKSKGIDELLIVNAPYGLFIEYYGMIELKKVGYCSIFSEIIDLNDNSIIFKDASVGMGKIKGKWNTPPGYESLKTAIKTAIDNSIELEKTKFK